MDSRSRPSNKPPPLICLHFNPSGFVWATWFSACLLEKVLENSLQIIYPPKNSSPAELEFSTETEETRATKCVFYSCRCCASPAVFAHFSWGTTVKGETQGNAEEGILWWTATTCLAERETNVEVDLSVWLPYSNGFTTGRWAAAHRLPHILRDADLIVIQAS